MLGIGISIICIEIGVMIAFKVSQMREEKLRE